MNDLQSLILLWAAILGTIAAGSMVLGSIIGITTPLSNTMVGAMCGFGAGALISALALELVAPTVMALMNASVNERLVETHHFLTLIFSLLLGGIIFIFLDQILSSHGGYLRKSAYVIAQHAKNKTKQTHDLIQSIGNSSFLNRIPPEITQSLLHLLHPRFIIKDEVLFSNGDPSNELYIIRSGQLTLNFQDGSSRIMEKGSLIGEVSFLAKQPHSSSAIAAHGAVELLVLHKQQYQNFVDQYPKFSDAIRHLASERISENIQKLDQTTREKQQWADLAIKALRAGGSELPQAYEITKMKDSHGNAGLAIWLGNLLDVIPESFVIGTVMLSMVSVKSASGVDLGFFDVMPMTLVGALFLSNFPEALSASVNMKHQGFSNVKILLLWLSLTLICAVGAIFGAYVGETIPHSAMVAVEGIAAGAMLTMIGSAMLPEAAHLSTPNVAGFSTLVGFITAVGFKLFE